MSHHVPPLTIPEDRRPPALMAALRVDRVNTACAVTRDQIDLRLSVLAELDPEVPTTREAYMDRVDAAWRMRYGRHE